MEKLLSLASKSADAAEVFYYESDDSSLSVENGAIKDMDSSIQAGYALRIIKDKKIGFAYTKNLNDPQRVLDNALSSLMGNVMAGFSFPGKSAIHKIDQYDSSVESLTFSDLKDQCEAVVSALGDMKGGQVDVYSGFGRIKMRIVNTAGADYEARGSAYYIFPQASFPNSKTSVRRGYYHTGLLKIPTKDLEEQAATYHSALKEIDVESGKKMVMFSPENMFTLTWRITMGAHARYHYEKTSPVFGKSGQMVLSEMVTMFNDPHDTSAPGATAFDDEGVPTKRFTIYENGVFKDFYVNLDYAAKMGTTPTGTGFRKGMFMSGDPVTVMPEPVLPHLRIKPGKESFSSLMGMMDYGIILHDDLGMHSGNLLNGDFSVGANPGFVVKKGEIIGRTKDAMVAGNAYELFRNVAGIEDKVHYKHGIQRHPYVLFNNVSVAGKK